MEGYTSENHSNSIGLRRRLNAENQDELGRLKILQDDWQRERDALVTSIESLLTRFRAAR